jgi:hypothetical protein
MLDRTDAETTTITVGLIDDAYCAWFNAEAECEMALREWCSATGDSGELAYLDYVAALDREEASARDLEQLWRAASDSDAVPVAQAQNVAD